MKSAAVPAMPLPPDCGACGLKMRLGEKIVPPASVAG